MESMSPESSSAMQPSLMPRSLSPSPSPPAKDLSPTELTPRSKIKALLASVEDDDDDDGNSHRLADMDQTHTALSTHEPATKSAVLDFHSNRVQTPLHKDSASSDSDNDSDEVTITRPRGKLAARLHRRDEPSIDPDASSGSEQSIGAYARVRQRLLQNKSSEVQSSRQASQELADNDISHTSSEANGVRRRFLQKKKQRQQPQPTSDNDDEIPDAADVIADALADPRSPHSSSPSVFAEETRHGSTAEIIDTAAEDPFDAEHLPSSRPTRKASKKALEEMNRETQRLARNMQLAPEAQTRKKISKASFLERVRNRNSREATHRVEPTSSTGTSSALASEADIHPETPPTSPLRDAGDVLRKQSTLNSPLASVSSIKDKGKGKAPMPPPSPAKPLPPLIKSLPQSKLRAIYSSDSDLEITEESQPPPDRGNGQGQTKPQARSTLPVFERVPLNKANDARSMIKLRALAHLDAPERKVPTAKGMMTPAQLQASLRQKARLQAVAERNARLQQLRDKGVVIQTSEERERDQAAIEDILDKARREVEELTKKERDELRQQKRERGESTSLADSSGDEDYHAESEGEINLSGSDEDEDEHETASDQNVDPEGETGLPAHPLASAPGPGAPFVESADEASAADDDEIGSRPPIQSKLDINAGLEDDAPTDPALYPRAHRARAIIDDDDDEAEAPEAKPPVLPAAASATRIENPFLNPFGPQQVQDGNSPMGLTQAFAASLADAEESLPPLTQEEDSMAAIQAMHLPPLPTRALETLVDDSQPAAESAPEFDPKYSQSLRQQDDTQVSQMPDPTQDAGFGEIAACQDDSAISNIQDLVRPASTVDTILIAPPESPLHQTASRKRRLQRRKDQSASAEESNDDQPPQQPSLGVDAFDVMKEALRKDTRSASAYDKEKSKAKAMVEEQAEESEDEYAGLGGASDDEGAAENEHDRRMIDEDDVDVDERGLAAYFADEERAADAKNVEKLFRDIQNGNLRRKRGAEFDLSDSDDEVETRRRERRRAEHARMRKALLEDTNVGQIADDPRKSAFLRAIENRDDEEDLDILDAHDAGLGESQEGTQPQLNNETNNSNITDAETSVSAQKRPLEDDGASAGNRLPPAHRRTAAVRKPLGLSDIRESVSFLTDHPADNAAAIALDPSSDNSADEQADDGIDLSNPRRRRRPAEQAIVDRLSLKRADSSTASTVSDGSTRMAFHDPRTTMQDPGFRVPSLVRRATSSFSVDDNGISTAGNTALASINTKEVLIRSGATRRSGVGYMMRREREVRVGMTSVSVEMARQQRTRLGSVLGTLHQNNWG